MTICVGSIRPPSRVPSANAVENSGSRASGSPSGSDTVTFSACKSSWCVLRSIPMRTPEIAIFEPDAGTLERRLDIGRQPVQLDRPLHQAPDAEQQHQDHDRRERADPAQHAMGAATDPAGRPPMQRPPGAPAGCSPRQARPPRAGPTSRISLIDRAVKLLSHISAKWRAAAAADPRRPRSACRLGVGARRGGRPAPRRARPGLERHPRRRGSPGRAVRQQPIPERVGDRRMGFPDPARRGRRRPAVRGDRRRHRKTRGSRRKSGGVDAPPADRQAPRRSAGGRRRTCRQLVARTADGGAQPLRRRGDRRRGAPSAARRGGKRFAQIVQSRQTRNAAAA